MSGVLTSPPRSSGHSQPTQPGEFSLIDMLLRQQQETAVERFARATKNTPFHRKPAIIATSFP